jgi:hypothetical protein
VCTLLIIITHKVSWTYIGLFQIRNRVYYLLACVKFAYYKLSSGHFPGVWMLYADVSEHSVPSSWAPMKMELNVPKRRHVKFRRRGITQKKAYNIQSRAKVWNKEYICILALLLWCNFGSGICELFADLCERVLRWMCILILCGKNSCLMGLNKCVAETRNRC